MKKSWKCSWSFWKSSRVWFLEPRSTKDFPYPALEENKIVNLIDKACDELGYKKFKNTKAILTKEKGHRNPCYYSNYCGSYACSSGAKGSSRASLIKDSTNYK